MLLSKIGYSTNQINTLLNPLKSPRLTSLVFVYFIHYWAIFFYIMLFSSALVIFQPSRETRFYICRTCETHKHFTVLVGHTMRYCFSLSHFSRSRIYFSGIIFSINFSRWMTKYLKRSISYFYNNIVTEPNFFNWCSLPTCVVMGIF